uniref:Reverse transcriptase zinc-binding domain-containing protein n=1 Tax=Fagus sylvatica TaxID=28930 RepID=A0A2N9HMH7_FAGSY
MSVATLIDVTTNSWNLTLLSELFDANSVEAILKIILPASPKEDRLIRVVDSKGKFLVKSAFKLSQSPVVTDAMVDWSALWKLKIHDHLKMLIWRIASGILPTKQNLVQRLGFGDSKCPLCQTEDESLEHLFFKCSLSRAIWFGACEAIQSDLISPSTCQDFIKFICDLPLPTSTPLRGNMSSINASIMFALTLDCIWSVRNKAHEVSPLHSDQPVGFWSNPPEDFIKLNVDAALSPTKATIAVIARNSMGSIIKAWAKEVPLLDPMVVEAMAIVWALELALSEKFAKVIVESDAKMCIDDLYYPTDADCWKIRNFSVCSIDLIFGFVSCNVQWVCREGNQVAHALA